MCSYIPLPRLLIDFHLRYTNVGAPSYLVTARSIECAVGCAVYVGAEEAAVVRLVGGVRNQMMTWWRLYIFRVFR